MVMRSERLFILSRGRGVLLEFYHGVRVSTVRRNPLLSESDRRGFSPDITNAPHLRLLAGDGERWGGEGRGSTHELLGRGEQKEYPVLSTGRHFGTTVLVALRLVFVPHSLFCAPLTPCSDGS